MSEARAVYELPLEEKDTPREMPVDSDSALPAALLIENAFWFTRLRWGAVAVVLLFGFLGFWKPFFARYGLNLEPAWPLALGAVLIVANALFTWLGHRCAQVQSRRAAHGLLWAQILLDLVLLTVFIHHAGCTQTYAPFLYLGHIVLACIFFTRRVSMLVTLSACVLYAGCVFTKTMGWMEPAGVFLSSTQISPEDLTPAATTLHITSMFAIWLSVWYLAARLSYLVRRRDQELALANRRLIRTAEERTSHMLRTTHELKAPFAAIHANIQLLLEGHCGELSEPALDVARRMEARCSRLSEEIKQMLQLANLRSAGPEAADLEEIGLREPWSWCLTQARDAAGHRGVAIQSDLQPVRVRAVQDHLRMMFENLLTNAIVYSNPGDCVTVSCRPRPEGGAEVAIADQGIGIPAEKLPRIFEDYYRTEEAVSHNKGSSGLGLSIVRKVAQRYGLNVRVETVLERGTTFLLRFPTDRVVGR